MSWDLKNIRWPQLDKLNSGQLFTVDTPVTHEIFNAIVEAIIYLYYHVEEEAENG